MKHLYKVRFFQLKTLLYVIAFLFFSNVALMAQNPFHTKGKSHIKTSLNAYSFNTMLQQSKKDPLLGLSLMDLLEFCAQQNFDAIDITGYFFSTYPEVPSDEEINAVKKRAFELGLDISGTGIKNDFANPDAAKRTADVKLAKAWIDVAVKLGAPVIRVFAGELPKGYENRREEVANYMAECLKECAAYGKSRGVLVGVQNHGDFLSTADECLDMLRRVNSDWLGLVVDSGKFLTKDPYVDFAKAMPFAVNLQIKESPIGAGSGVKTDLPRLIKIIKDSGYRGYVPIETLEYKGKPRPGDIPYNPYVLVPAFMKDVRAAINEIYKK